MDTKEKKAEVTEATETTTQPFITPCSGKTIILTPEQSIIIQKSPAEKESTTTSPITVKSKSLGFFTGLKDWAYGEPATVAHEIAHDKFDKTIPANLRCLSKALEKETQAPSADNLKQLQEILDNCRTKEISIDDLSVLQLVRKYSHEMRTKEEEQLTEETKVSLQNADKERSTLIADLKKKFIEVIEKANAIDKKLTEDLDAVNKKHSETIFLGTEVKRLTRMVNKHIPEDDYDSDTESKYDRPFNARKLGLENPTTINHKLNRKVADNFETLKNIVDLADKQSIKAHGE